MLELDITSAVQDGRNRLVYHTCQAFNPSVCHILMLIKKPSHFTGFAENKYRHETVMITKLYIVSNIMYDHHLYEYII